MYRNMPTFKNYTLTNVKVMKNSLTNQIILIATNFSTLDLASYDFTSKENESKWKGIFISGLQRVAQRLGHQMKAKEDALDHVEKLILQLLSLLFTRPSPHTVQEVQDRVQKMFLPPIDTWAIDEAANAIKQGKKKIDLVFPIDKIHSLLQKDVMQVKIDHNFSVYVTAILEYIAADVLNLVGNYVKHSRDGEFTIQDIKAAMCCDKVLCDLFKLGDNVSVNLVEEPIARNFLTYNEVIEDLLQFERQYLRDLHMLVKVFREQLTHELENDNQTLKLAFDSIDEITELTITLISMIEDIQEMSEPNQVPGIGSCFLELAENGEFDVYVRYAEAFTNGCQNELTELLSRPDVETTVSTAGHGVFEAVKFYFPNLLLEPFHHCPQYFDYIKLFHRLSPSEIDKTDLIQAESIFTSLIPILETVNIPKKANGDFSSRMSGKGSKCLAQQKLLEIKNQVEGFNDSFGQSYFNEFFCESELQKIGSAKKPSERYAYLFDGFLLLCKQNYRRTSVVTGGSQYEYRLKESFYLTKVEVHDKEDTDEWKNLFEIVPRDQTPIILSARTPEEKSGWMSALVMLTTKSMLDRILDRILSDDEKKHPLRLPSPERYRFAVEDSERNIIFDKDSGNHFVIKGATLLKLIERLTHHQYSDPKFVNTFLTTYRSFCSPHEFLDLLIERFNIPEPEFRQEEIEQEEKKVWETLKRFRKVYVRMVKLRVLNVIKQWIIHHYYDFERDLTLKARLEDFLSDADEGKKRTIFDSVRRCLEKAMDSSRYFDRSLTAVKSPPPTEYHIKCPFSEWNILTIHPIEFARQLTLLEFDYYRVVKPSELVGSVWTKKNKEQASPNLLRMIKHTTNVTRWFERTIIDAENFDERIAIYSRILEIMIVLQELNNFNGVLAVVSAMGSASVYRLKHTKSEVKVQNKRLIEALDEAKELQDDHYKKYQEKLRSINPPCVPFFGMYLSNILHIEEGNLDFLPNSPDLINFGKRRKVAQITSEIRQFQYSHYELGVEPKIREFLMNVQPFPPDESEHEISNYLFDKSLEIEPKGYEGKGGKKYPIFPRKWPELNLKSPGIKPRHLRGRPHPGPLLPFKGSSLSFHSSASQMTLDSADTDSIMDSMCHTPKTLTPNSAISPTSTINDGQDDFSVFVPVLLPSEVPNTSPGSRGIGFSRFNIPPHNSSHHLHSHSSLPPMPSNPPPLPPRTKKSSVGDSPKDPDLPPPLPPRKSPATPIPPIPRRNSATTPNANCPPSHPNQMLSPSRTPHENGPQQNSLPSPTSVEIEHRPIFDFQGPVSPFRGARPPPPLNLSPPIAPKLPPKTKTLNNSHN